MRRLWSCLLILCFVAAPAAAQDPVDGRLGPETFQLEPDGDDFVLRFKSGETRTVTRETVSELVGADRLEALTQPRGWLYRLFNIWSPSEIAWVALGLLGQLAFFLRMLVQWVASERKKESVVPEVFWWLSLGGCVALLAYFVWRWEPVGILGQSPGLIVYTRNLWLIRMRKLQADG